MAFPAATTIALAVGRQAPGATSALAGGGQFILAALVSPIIGAFSGGNAMPMAVIILISFVSATALLFLLARPAQGHGEIAAAEPEPAAKSS